MISALPFQELDNLGRTYSNSKIGEAIIPRESLCKGRLSKNTLRRLCEDFCLGKERSAITLLFPWGQGSVLPTFKVKEGQGKSYR